MPKSQNVPATGGSRRGYHYYDEYNECPRKFYFHRVVGLEEIRSKEALVKGEAFHRATESFVFNGLQAFVEEEVKAVFDESNLEEEEKSTGMAEVMAAYRLWQPYGEKDLLENDIISVEGSYERFLPDGQLFTCRIDCLMKDRLTGRLKIVDRKTSSRYNAAGIAKNTELDDQLPLYVWLVEQEFGEKPTCMVDAAKLGKYPEVAREEFYFDQDVIDDALESLLKTRESLRDDLRLLAERPKWHQRAFARHTLKCRLWGCSYVNICRSRIELDDIVPSGEFERIPPDFDTISN